ncbi:replication initiator [Microlunatus speluncae]|uniref:replication initiator n=1 Tax=Microlunatus speluncae TaxID=2594267 RepID=UPI001FE8525A|nr:replication initiator [Microlunatus speluncae]
METATVTELADARNRDIAGQAPSVQGLTDLAVKHGVCVRPVLQRLIDTATGETRIVPIPCGTTRADRCPPCADRNRKLRMTQCREGWHLDTEPDTDDHDTTEDPDDDQDQADDDDQDQDRRVRSTRRRQDMPDLPKGDHRDGTVARQMTSPNGQSYRPSMFLTVTLGSYGPVHAETGRCRCGEHHRPGSPLAGTPLFPHRYDYRRAALDVLHFGKLADRLWKNMRRVAGFEMQYFATVEPQRRGAMHLHVATRGAMTGTLLRQVVAATYHQLWWPPHDTPVYTDPARMPVWHADRQTFVDRFTRRALPTWDEALDAIDADPAARPAHVTRFGPQVDHRWLIGGSDRTEKVIGYLCKYLTKSVSDTLSGPEDDHDPTAVARTHHLDRLHAQVRILPCAPECGNWLRYGVQPKDANGKTTPGHCRRKAHRRENLGYGGRRALVSRRWTGKTLADHRADRAEVVRQVLTAAGIDMPEPDEYSATAPGDNGEPRYRWEVVKLDDADRPTYLDVIGPAVNQRHRWRAQYDEAKRAGPQPGINSTIGLN